MIFLFKICPYPPLRENIAHLLRLHGKKSNRVHDHPFFHSSRLQQAPAIKRTDLIVPDPFLEAILMEDVPALCDGGECAAFGEVRQADRAPIALHVGLVVDYLQHSLETVDWFWWPTGDSFRDQNEHAANGKPHDGVHIQEIVNIRIGVLKPGLFLRIDDELIRVLGLELGMRDELDSEDGDEDSEEEEESEDHAMVEVIKFQQDEQADDDEDMYVE